MTRNHIPSGAQVRVLQASEAFFLLLFCLGSVALWWRDFFGLVANLVVEEICQDLALRPTTPHEHHPNPPSLLRPLIYALRVDTDLVASLAHVLLFVDNPRIPRNETTLRDDR
jgi:hypothetical protein